MCSLDVAHPFATVRNRSREDRMAVPIGSFPGRVVLGTFDVSRSFISRGRRGTS